MKKLFPIILVCLAWGTLQAQNITFTDPNFKATLLTITALDSNSNYVAVDANGDGEISISEAEAIYRLSINGFSIANIAEINYFTNLQYFTCNYNQLTSLNLQGLTNLQYLDCSDNQLSSLNVQGLSNLQYLTCYDNQLPSLNVQGLSNLEYLDCSNNQLPSLNVQGLTNLQVFSCSQNQLPSLNIQGLTNLVYFWCGMNQIPFLNLQGLYQLAIVSCPYNLLSTLDLSGLSGLQYFDCGNNPLTMLNAKCGAAWVFDAIPNSFYFNNTPNLTYICIDDDNVTMIQQKITGYGYTNCHVNSYCSFTPGATYYTLNGTNRYDENNNGCDAMDITFPNLKFNIASGTDIREFITDASGQYSYDVQAGNYTLTPQLENPSYFNVSPNTPVSVSFPTQASPFTQAYCITPNGVHHDLEVTIIPLSAAIPGFQTIYKIIYKNKGNQNELATLHFTFDDAIVNVSYASLTPSQQNVGEFIWNLGTVTPFQTGEIVLAFNLNSPLDTPPLNVGTVLNFSASINGLYTDETPSDNVFSLPQTVVNSHDPNEKVCLEGNQLDESMIGHYVHYMIRFENTGTYPAQNIVVSDVIDATQFDVSSIQMVASSHNGYTRIKDNKLEFIFENINLPFDDAHNDGYVVFKIKTLPTLPLNSSISNTANVFFDYNAPIVTNTATSTFTTMTASSFVFEEAYSLSPVPAKETLTLTAKQPYTISSLSVYNTLGQIMMLTTNPDNTINVSHLASGTYVLKITTDHGTSSQKFIKE